MSVEIHSHSPNQEANTSSGSLRGTWADEVVRSERKGKKPASRDDASSPSRDSLHNLSNCSSNSQDRKIAVEFLDEVNEEKFKRLCQEEKIKTPFKRRHDENDSRSVSPNSSNSDDSNNCIKHTEGKRLRHNSQASSSNSSGYIESDPAILSRRQKQIDYGKNTVAYERYIEQVPRDERTRDHPRTPNKYGKYSRRAFDGLVKIWRKQLHHYDPPSGENKDNQAESSSDESD